MIVHIPRKDNANDIIAAFKRACPNVVMTQEEWDVLERFFIDIEADARKAAFAEVNNHV
jgi:hypothetical protein